MADLGATYRITSGVNSVISKFRDAEVVMDLVLRCEARKINWKERRHAF